MNNFFKLTLIVWCNIFFTIMLSACGINQEINNQEKVNELTFKNPTKFTVDIDETVNNVIEEKLEYSDELQKVRKAINEKNYAYAHKLIKFIFLNSHDTEIKVASLLLKAELIKIELKNDNSYLVQIKVLDEANFLFDSGYLSEAKLFLDILKDVGEKIPIMDLYQKIYLNEQRYLSMINQTNDKINKIYKYIKNHDFESEEFLLNVNLLMQFSENLTNIDRLNPSTLKYIRRLKSLINDILLNGARSWDSSLIGVFIYKLGIQKNVFYEKTITYTLITKDLKELKITFSHTFPILVESSIECYIS